MAVNLKIQLIVLSEKRAYFSGQKRDVSVTAYIAATTATSRLLLTLTEPLTLSRQKDQ